LTFVEAATLDAKSLTKNIADILEKHQPASIVSQGYDGGSVMSDCCTGTSVRA